MVKLERQEFGLWSPTDLGSNFSCNFREAASLFQIRAFIWVEWV